MIFHSEIMDPTSDTDLMSTWTVEPHHFQQCWIALKHGQTYKQAKQSALQEPNMLAIAAG